MRYIESSHEQGSPEWRAERLGRLTGSIASSIFSHSRTVQIQLALERLGVTKEGFSSADTERGHELEPYARMAYEQATGNIVQQCGFLRLPTIMAGCSPDGLVGDSGMVEIKCPQPHIHIGYLLDTTIPAEYYWQMVHELWVTGREWCHFVSYAELPEGINLHIKLIQPSKAEIEMYEMAALAFLAKVSDIETTLKEKLL